MIQMKFDPRQASHTRVVVVAAWGMSWFWQFSGWFKSCFQSSNQDSEFRDVFLMPKTPKDLDLMNRNNTSVAVGRQVLKTWTQSVSRAPFLF